MYVCDEFKLAVMCVCVCVFDGAVSSVSTFLAPFQSLNSISIILNDSSISARLHKHTYTQTQTELDMLRGDCVERVLTHRVTHSLLVSHPDCLSIISFVCIRCESKWL